MKRGLLAVVAVTAAFATESAAFADNVFGGDEGKFLLTAGFNDIDGAGGGGIVPLAFISGYESQDSWGANAHFTNVQLRDFHLRAYGVTLGLFDRVELSATRHQLDVTGTPLDGLGVDQDIFGVKVQLFGDAVYNQDSWLPQVAAGIEYKKNDGIEDSDAVGLRGLISTVQLGARTDHAADYYLAASKVLLSPSVLLNVVLRYTKANQFGLLGFGGDLHSGYSLEPEASVAYLLSQRLALGAEYRSRPHNLSADEETKAWDVFAAWAPTKNISIVMAYADVGSILAPVTKVDRRQNGIYLSFQAGF